MSEPVTLPVSHRDLTREELQRCADAANRVCGTIAEEGDLNIAARSIDKAEWSIGYPWHDAVRAEAARILASDSAVTLPAAPTPEQREIAELRKRLALATRFVIGTVEITGYRRVHAVNHEREWYVLDRAADHRGDRVNIDPATGKWAAFTPYGFSSMEAAFAALDAATNADRATGAGRND